MTKPGGGPRGVWSKTKLFPDFFATFPKGCYSKKTSISYKIYKGGGVKPVYKKLCCKICIVLKAFLQHKWAKNEILRSELSQNCQHIIANHTFLKRGERGVYGHFLKFIKKKTFF